MQQHNGTTATAALQTATFIAPSNTHRLGPIVARGVVITAQLHAKTLLHIHSRPLRTGYWQLSGSFLVQCTSMLHEHVGQGKGLCGVKGLLGYVVCEGVWFVV